MATPIQITPVLSGKDAVFFNKQLVKSSRKNRAGKTKMTAKEKAKIFSLVNKVLAKKSHAK